MSWRVIGQQEPRFKCLWLALFKKINNNNYTLYIIYILSVTLCISIPVCTHIQENNTWLCRKAGKDFNLHFHKCLPCRRALEQDAKSPARPWGCCCVADLRRTSAKRIPPSRDPYYTRTLILLFKGNDCSLYVLFSIFTWGGGDNKRSWSSHCNHMCKLNLEERETRWG